MKKKLIIGLSYVLLIAMALTATVAYFTDTDSAVNVMTVGNIDIDQIEQERGENGALEPFTQNKPLLPCYYEGSSIPWAAADTWPVANDLAWRVTEGNTNVIDKFVTVKNTGKNGAYVRTIIAFEAPTQELSDKLHIVVNIDNVTDRTTWSLNWVDGRVMIDGVAYDIGVFTYNGVLPAGETTVPSLKQVYMDKSITQEKAAAYGDTFEILVYTQAVQADMGVADMTAEKALNAAFNGAITAANHPWMQVDLWDGTADSDLENDATAKVYTISSAEELAGFSQLVASGKTFSGETVMLTADIDLANKAWTPIGNATNKFCGTFDGNGYTISNLYVDGGKNSNQGLFGFTTDGEIKNVKIHNAKVSGRLNVGVVAGDPYTTKYTNISVTGLVQVNGMAYVGGVGGKDAYANWKNISVMADEGSYVKAISVENGTAYRTYVGGVVGFMGEGNHGLTNVTSNIDVFGSTCDVGGIVGIAHYGNSFVNCSSSGNVTITDAEEAEEAEQLGGIAGVWHNNEDVTFDGCSYTGTLSANVAVDLSDNTIVGAPYNATGSGNLIIK